MELDKNYDAIMSRRGEIIKNAVGMDYSKYESGSIAFDYEQMMSDINYSIEDIANIQSGFSIGNTKIVELKNITELARKISKPGYGARIFIKDEATNPSGSFKVRRAAMSVHQAKKLGYKGVVTATSGNYGAAVASVCAMAGLKCIIVQECFDSKTKGQPEIIEKARKCEALGAEVVQLTVGPELFSSVLSILEDTGYFNASLYTPFGIAGVETLGYEIAEQFRKDYDTVPDMVLCSNAGGGNLTGTARGLLKAGVKIAGINGTTKEAADTEIVAASVNLKGLHMASDTQFNKKSFTTSHTGFGMPFATNPDRSDVPRSAARPLRYMDRYVTVNQGEVFYITEMLASLEGLEKGPAGNTALAAAFSLAQEMPADKTIVVQETEYTGAGKHINPQLSFARNNGINIMFGDPKDEIAGENIILPSHPNLIKAVEVDMNKIRYSLIKNKIAGFDNITDADISFLASETKTDEAYVKSAIETLKAGK